MIRMNEDTDSKREVSERRRHDDLSINIKRGKGKPNGDSAKSEPEHYGRSFLTVAIAVVIVVIVLAIWQCVGGDKQLYSILGVTNRIKQSAGSDDQASGGDVNKAIDRQSLLSMLQACQTEYDSFDNTKADRVNSVKAPIMRNGYLADPNQIEQINVVSAQTDRGKAENAGSDHQQKYRASYIDRWGREAACSADSMEQVAKSLGVKVNLKAQLSRMPVSKDESGRVSGIAPRRIADLLQHEIIDQVRLSAFERHDSKVLQTLYKQWFVEQCDASKGKWLDSLDDAGTGEYSDAKKRDMYWRIESDRTGAKIASWVDALPMEKRISVRQQINQGLIGPYYAKKKLVCQNATCSAYHDDPSLAELRPLLYVGKKAYQSLGQDKVYYIGQLSKEIEAIKQASSGGAELLQLPDITSSYDNCYSIHAKLDQVMKVRRRQAEQDSNRYGDTH